jgi:hypothetical protein
MSKRLEHIEKLPVLELAPFPAIFPLLVDSIKMGLIYLVWNLVPEDQLAGAALF